MFLCIYNRCFVLLFSHTLFHGTNINPSDYYCCFESTRSDCTGKTDIQVSVEDAELLKKACPAARFLLIDRMNHVLKDCDVTDQQQQLLFIPILRYL